MRIFLCLLLAVAACTGKPKPLCTDADGDGVSAGTSPTCGGDCNDNDRTVYRTVTLFTDADGDGLGVGTGKPQCIGALVPKGFATKSGDCDDNDQHCTVDCSDQDHDGVRACDGDLDDTNPHCILTLVDHDADGYCADHDCNDNSPLHWDDCATCIDTDGDGHGEGCDVGTSDCDDNDTDNWDQCGTCVDADGDQFWTGCNRYVTRQGEDCDDTSPACTLDCQDSDNDKVSACQGDCNDSRGTSTPCTLFGTGSVAQIADVAGGNGANITILAIDSITLVGSDDALPAGTFLTGAVPPLATATSICTGATNLKLACAAQTLNSFPSPVAGFFVPKGVTLTLHGAGPFTMNSTGDVFIGGSLVTDTPGASIVINGDGVHDFTLSGSIDTHAATCAGPTKCDAGNITLHNFANAALLGNINAFGAPGPATLVGGVGGTITIDATNAYFASSVDIHSGENQSATSAPNGGTFGLTASTVVARLNISAAGGNALGGHGGALPHPQDPGNGGGVTLRAVNGLASSAGFNVTLLGGVATGPVSANNNGGVGGSATVQVQDGAGAETLSSPTLIVTGGASANGAGGVGGAVQILIGNDDSTLRTLSVTGRIDASGGGGATNSGVPGTVTVASEIKTAGAGVSATLSIDAPMTCNGAVGSGVIEIGVFDLATPYDNRVTGADVSIAANITTTGDLAINADTLSGATTSSLVDAACDISSYTNISAFSTTGGGACSHVNTAPPF